MRIFVLAIVALALCACGALSYQASTAPPPVGTVATSTTPAQLAAYDQALHAQQAAATQPGATVKAPDPQLVKTVDAELEAVNKLNLAPAAPVNVFPVAPQLPPIVVQAGNGIQQVSPLLPEPWGSAATGGWLILTTAFSIYSKIQASRSNKATASVNTGLQNAINAGAITVTPAAPAIVNAAVLAHPATDQTVDILSAASKTPLIQG